MVRSHTFLEEVLRTYYETGTAALERKEYRIALKMFRAIFDEPCSKIEKERYMLPLLVKSAQAYEGMNQLYKAKLLYVRALAQHKKVFVAPTMQAVEILLVLSHLTAQQGLYRQAVDFALEAQEAYNHCLRKEPVAFVRCLRRTERIMQFKGRVVEQQQLVSILEQVKTEALLSIPSVADVVPMAIAPSVPALPCF